MTRPRGGPVACFLNIAGCRLSVTMISGIAPGLLAFWDGPSLPSGWSAPIEPKERFLRGAAAAGDGGATGGAATHQHTEAAHDHPDAWSGTASAGSHQLGQGTKFAGLNHAHSVPLSAATELLSAANGEPGWEKLQVIRNDNAGEDLPAGIMALYIGTVAGIPSGWARRTPASGADFVKGASSAGEIALTGGPRQHAHSATSHTHTKGTVGSADVLVADDNGTESEWHSLSIPKTRTPSPLSG